MTDTFGKADAKLGAKPGVATASSPLVDMMEATWLAGLGRLEEADALIQRSLGLGTPGPAARQPAPRDPPARRDEAWPDPAARVREVVDSVVRGLAPVLKGLTPVRPAPPQPREPGGFFDRAYSDSAGARAYKLFVPDDPATPAPLVVMLHGCTQNPDDFAAGTGMNALAQRAGIFVAYPAQSRSAHAQRCWNWYEPRDQGRGSGEPAIVAGITRAVMAAHPIDPARIYIAGMSAGGAAALSIAHAYPDLYAAVGVHSGLAAGCARDLGSALMAMQVGAPGLGTPAGLGAPSGLGQRVPTLVFHGEDDGTVSVRNADQVVAQAGTAGLTARVETFGGNTLGGKTFGGPISEGETSQGRGVTGPGHPFTRTRYVDAAGRVMIEDWRVRGAGHAWSGGQAEGSYTDADGPDASRAMLDFFAGHRLGPAGA